MKKPYDTTIARIAGNILSGVPMNVWWSRWGDSRAQTIEAAVEVARAICREVERTEPQKESMNA